MIIWVVLTVVLLILVPVVLKRMKVPEYSTYTAPKILGKVGDLVKSLFNLGDIIKQSQQNSEYRGEFYENINPSNTTPQPISNDAYSL